MEPDKKRIGYLNGQWMPHTEMSIGIDDTGFRQSITAVERLRTYRGRIFALDAHLRRWSWTTSKLAIDNLPDPEAIASLLMELISENSELVETFFLHIVMGSECCFVHMKT